VHVTKIELATIDDISQLCRLLAVLFAQETEYNADAAKTGSRTQAYNRKSGDRVYFCGAQ
jgi:hypothetical protein